jgi:arabinogalactan oligomer/maltooligosaccharide transport system substrate-binding protein
MKNVKKLLWTVLVVLMLVATSCQSAPAATQAPAADTKAPEAATEAPAAAATEAPTATTVPTPAVFGKGGGTEIVLWTKEGEADKGLQYVQSLVSAFVEANPNVMFTVVNKDVETLRQDFQTSSLGGNPPDLLWTVSDHAGPFVTADLIQPVNDLVDLSKYVASVEMNGKTWAVPISSGNHLMLLYNKDMVKEAPKTTDDLIKVGQELTKDGKYGLVYNQTEPFWLVPWLGGFGGKVFADDGVTPTLNTPEMVNTFQFLYDIKYTTPIVPAESDYNGADSLFKEGKAAMIINGDWSLGDYKTALGDKLGIAPIPQVSATGKWSMPYTSGVYFMVPKDLKGDKLDIIKKFMEFATSQENQLKMVKDLSRLPGLKSALADPSITSDPVLSASADAMQKGTPMPTVLEMRCVWDGVKPQMQAVLAKSTTPKDAAAASQSAAETCIKALQ